MIINSYRFASYCSEPIERSIICQPDLIINMKITYILSIISFTLILSSCGAGKYATMAKDGEVEMSLSKGMCFGKCPVYNLKVMKGGMAEISAKKHVQGKKGLYRKKMDKDAYTELLKAFKESNYTEFLPMYKSNIPDLPMVTIGYMANDTLALVRGKEERPSGLMQLQYKMEKLAQSEGWDLIEEYTRPDIEEQEKEPAYILSEIIILPNPGTMLPRWFKTYEEFGLRVLKRITPNQNYWLVTYDQGKIKPEKIMTMLKADASIKEAEFNKETSTREDR